MLAEPTARVAVAATSCNTLKLSLEATPNWGLMGRFELAQEVRAVFWIRRWSCLANGPFLELRWNSVRRPTHFFAGLRTLDLWNFRRATG